MAAAAAAAASACGRRVLAVSSLSATFCSSFRSISSAAAEQAAKSGGFSARFSRRKLPFLSRLPSELGCVQSLMPLHSVTASVLLTSKLSLKTGSWGWLSEANGNL
ncbi:protein NUCLEAR FUSION DEFECTIVE 6, mitochondrial-like isoform X2 [Magnolia sinica]|uniref:protein NUCLEAR FUSION DEFECTIVE 6, mitochondrial-like isoform X2 n=1 Tax=Magnolia sinica TaxID=86752 RepID=UPI0026595E96|nr:protein NUCLEAR FUSION DEFECTIVE 6, mitochondrial-like isoform X2 [Magnolia sinica]